MPLILVWSLSSPRGPSLIRSSTPVLFFPRKLCPAEKNYDIGNRDIQNNRSLYGTTIKTRSAAIQPSDRPGGLCSLIAGLASSLPPRTLCNHPTFHFSKLKPTKDSQLSPYPQFKPDRGWIVARLQHALKWKGIPFLNKEN